MLKTDDDKFTITTNNPISNESTISTNITDPNINIKYLYDVGITAKNYDTLCSGVLK